MFHLNQIIHIYTYYHPFLFFIIIDKNKKSKSKKSNKNNSKINIEIDLNGKEIIAANIERAITNNGDLIISGTGEIKDYEDDIKDLSEDEDLLYDLNDNESPAVKKVTVGDAEEYFNELGLEYNVDYKDNSVEQNKKEKTRRSSVEETKIDDVKLNASLKGTEDFKDIILQKRPSVTRTNFDYYLKLI